MLDAARQGVVARLCQQTRIYVRQRQAAGCRCRRGQRCCRRLRLRRRGGGRRSGCKLGPAHRLQELLLKIIGALAAATQE